MERFRIDTYQFDGGGSVASGRRGAPVAMDLSSVSVIANALRRQRARLLREGAVTVYR